MSIAIDSSTPTCAYGSDSGSSLVSNSFSPPASSLLVLLLGQGYSSGSTAVSSVTDSLSSHLTYAKLVAEAANNCDAEIWVAQVPASPPGSMTCTAIWAASGYHQFVAPIVVTGAAITQNGATQTATGTSGTPSATISALAGSNSLVLAMVTNSTNPTLPTIPSGQSDVFNSHTIAESDGGGFVALWGQYLTGMNLEAGSSATINDTAPTNITYSMAMAEILAASAAPAVLPRRPVTNQAALFRSMYRMSAREQPDPRKPWRPRLWTPARHRLALA